MRNLVAALVLLLSLWPAGAPAQGQYRAFWADGFHDGYKTPQQVDQLIADLKTAGANALIVQVRRRANSFYIKSLEPPVIETGYSPDFDALADIIAKAHAAGIEVHAWFAMCPLGSDAEAKADPRHILNTHGYSAPGRDNWMARSNAPDDPKNPAAVWLGESNNYWMDPAHPDAAAYTSDVIENVVENYAVDGIHLDTVRYSGNTWGYNPVSVERFNRLFLRTGSPAPADAMWSEFRRQQITALVRKIYLRTIEFRRDIKVSGSLIPWGDAPASYADWPKSSAYSGVMQDWVWWLREGILDFGVPMNYDREHDAVQKRYFDNWLAFERQNQGRRFIVTGIAAYLNSPDNTLAQAGRVSATPVGQAVLGGVAFYSYACTNWSQCGTGGTPVVSNKGFYTGLGLVTALLGGPPRVPDLTWKTAPLNGHVLGNLVVHNELRSPLADGVSMVLRPSPVSSLPKLTAVVDGTGSFGLVEVPPGTYTLTGYRGSTVVLPDTQVAVRAGEVTSLSLQLSSTALAVATPAPNQGGVTNAVTYSGAVLVPGSLLSIFGTGLADSTARPGGYPLPADLAGTQVLINGIAAPLLYVSPLQVNAQAPFGLQGGEATVVVRRWGVESAKMTAPIADAGPGLYPPVLKTDYSLVSPTNPVSRGSAVILWGTGFGEVTPKVAAGAAAPAGGAATIVRADLTVGGQPAHVLYSGLAPGFAGLYQLNIEIPADAPLGDMVAVQVIMVGRGSNNAFVAIR